VSINLQRVDEHMEKVVVVNNVLRCTRTDDTEPERGRGNQVTPYVTFRTILTQNVEIPYYSRNTTMSETEKFFRTTKGCGPQDTFARGRK